MQICVQDTYNRIFEQFQLNHLKETSQRIISQFFIYQIKNVFSIHLTMDNTIAKVLLQRLAYWSVMEQNSAKFIDLLSVAKRIEQALSGFNFINKRTATNLKKAFLQYEQSPNVKLATAIQYLKNSDGLREFRYEFLLKVVEKVPTLAYGEDIDEMTSNQEEMQRQYRQFWSKGMLKYPYNKEMLGFLFQIFTTFENKQQMLAPDLIHNLSKTLTGVPGRNRKEAQINKRLIQIAEANALENNETCLDQINNEIKSLELLLQKFAGLNIFTKIPDFKMRLGKFGSIVSGFASTGADLDVTILTNSYIEEKGFLSILAQFLNRQYRDLCKDTSKRVQVIFVSSAATPLIQLKIANDRLSRNRVSIDILLNNMLGVINSMFLNVYSKIAWVRNLGLLIKQWGKKRGIIDKNKFSSYSLILMLIHFLIRTRRVNIILEHGKKAVNQPSFILKRIKHGEEEKFEVHYKFKRRPSDVTVSEKENYLIVLTEFMKFYGQTIFELDEQKRLIEVDGGGKKINPDYIYTIKDPFDQPHNPARVRIDSKKWVISQFLRTYEVLQKKNITEIQREFNF